MRKIDEKNHAESCAHIPAKRLREVAEEVSILNIDEREHLNQCGPCVDYFGEFIRLLVQSRLKTRAVLPP